MHLSTPSYTSFLLSGNFLLGSKGRARNVINLKRMLMLRKRKLPLRNIPRSTKVVETPSPSLQHSGLDGNLSFVRCFH